MNTQLSGIKDVDRVILSKLDDKELLKVCSIDRHTWNTVCDDPFLKRRLLSKYPEIEKYKLENESWKQFFLNAVHYIALIKEKFEYSYTFGDFKKQYDLLKKYSKNINKLLLESAQEGELALVIWSLKRGVNILHENIDYALRLASKYGYLEVVKYLVEHGADDDYALKWASEGGHLEVVKYLIEHGADIHYALNLACEDGHYEVVKYLIEHGADIHTQNDYALRTASGNGYMEVVKYLVEHGADIHTDNDKALRTASGKGYLEVVKYLIEHGANIHANDDEAFKWASFYGRLEVVKYLAEHGAKNGRALKLAKENKHWEVVKYLKLFKTKNI